MILIKCHKKIQINAFADQWKRFYEIISIQFSSKKKFISVKKKNFLRRIWSLEKSY